MTDDWDGVDTRKRVRTWSREVGVGLMLSALITSLHYWTLGDVELIKAYSAAYNGLMLVLVPSGVAPFAVHRIKQK